MRKNKRKVIFIFLASVFLNIGVVGYATHKITKYQVIQRPCYVIKGRVLIAIRSFTKDGVPSFLCVDSFSFKTKIYRKSRLTFISRRSRWRTTPFMKMLWRLNSAPYRLANHGLRRINSLRNGVVLSVDLCPSRRRFDKNLFIRLMRLKRKHRGAVPVVIAVSGLWLKKYKIAFQWLRRQERMGRLQVDWVNHSLTHPYFPGRPLRKNFLLSPNTGFAKEVLLNEQIMLRHGLAPAPFFRFPGLIANGRLIQKLRAYSLIPLGSGSWLAKHEFPRPGDILLVHGNGNEPYGLGMLYYYFRQKRRAFKSGILRLFSLTQAARYFQ